MVKSGVIPNDFRKAPLVRGAFYTLNRDYPQAVGVLEFSDVLRIEDPEVDVTETSSTVKATIYDGQYMPEDKGSGWVFEKTRLLNHPEETSGLKRIAPIDLGNIRRGLERSVKVAQKEVEFLKGLEQAAAAVQ